MAGHRRFGEFAVHRLLQALGTYGFLGLQRSKTSFQSRIYRGINHLELSATQIPGMPSLWELIVQCRRSFAAFCVSDGHPAPSFLTGMAEGVETDANVI